MAHCRTRKDIIERLPNGNGTKAGGSTGEKVN